MPPIIEYDMLIEMLKYLEDDYKKLTRAVNEMTKNRKEARQLLNIKSWTQFEDDREKLIEKKNVCSNLILFIKDYLKEFK